MRIIQLTTDNREHHKDYSAGLPRFGPAPEALLEGFSRLPGIEVHVISCVREPVASPPAVFGSIRYHSVEVRKIGWLKSFYFGCIKATRSLIRDLAPDIVHGQGTERDCSMCAVHSGFPNVVTIHGNMAELNRLGMTFRLNPTYGRLVSLLEDHAVSRTAGVFCNSAYTESLVAPRAKRTWRVPNAIRAAFFAAPASGRDAGGPPMILNIGNITERKRQLEILRTMDGLRKAGHDFHMVFVGSMGDTDYSRAFQAELKQAELAGYASYAGVLDAQAVVSLMDRARGFVHFPSEEAFGLVVAEAMARELKFFGAALGGIAEIAAGVPGAELHGSFEELRRGMEGWLSSGAPRAPESAQAMKGRYHPEVVAARHLDIYAGILQK